MHLTLDTIAQKTMTTLKERCKAVSISEVVRRSVALLDLVTEHEAQGGKIIFQQKDGTQEVLKVLK